MLRIGVLLGLLVGCGVNAGENDAHQMTVERIVKAVQHAQKPFDAMQFEFEEIITGSGMVYRQDTAVPKKPPVIRNSFVVKISGQRSRIDQVYRQFVDDKAADASQVIQYTYAFNGTLQRKLSKPIQTKSGVLQGWQYYRDKNQSLILQKVYRSPVDFFETELLAKYQCELIYNEKEKVYLLKLVKENGTYYQFTIDPGKGCHILKMECYTARGLNYEVDYKLYRHENNLWYPLEVAKYRYSRNGKKFLENRVRFKKVTFCPKLADKEFEIEFPLGTKVWDGALQDWFVIQ